MSLPPGYEHQLRTVAGVRGAYHGGARRICVVVPTGGGKTWIGSAVVEGAIRKGRRVLWLAHRAELVDQAAASLARLGVAHGVVMAGRASAPTAPIQVASVQTLTARPQEFPPADIIVVDETHHAVAATWQALLGRFPHPELILGLTATPERGDRKPLGEASGGVYQSLIAVTSVAELQRTLRPDGSPILVPCRVVGPRSYTKDLFRDPVEGLLEFGRDETTGRLRRSILFASSVAQAEEIARSACSRGIRAASVDGKLDATTRRARLAAFAAGELELLTNVMVLTEGFDVPATEVCAIARGCEASSTFLQMVGRALRSSPETGKRSALLIDYRGLTHVHGLVDEDRTYSLEGRAIQTREKLGLSQCPACGSVFAPTPRCPECGHVIAMPRRAPKVTRSDAVELTRETVSSAADKRAAFDALVRQAREKGWKPAAAQMRFKARFGFWPPWPLPSTTSKGAA